MEESEVCQAAVCLAPAAAVCLAPVCRAVMESEVCQAAVCLAPVCRAIMEESVCQAAVCLAPAAAVCLAPACLPVTEESEVCLCLEEAVVADLEAEECPSRRMWTVVASFANRFSPRLRLAARPRSRPHPRRLCRHLPSLLPRRRARNYPVRQQTQRKKACQPRGCRAAEETWRHLTTRNSSPFPWCSCLS